MKGKEAGLQKAIRLEAQEGLQLDLKGVASDNDSAMFAADGKLTKDGRRTIAKALSA
ncbi:hypothetical protein [Mesorhizobium amorphae]|nr:hypothetical protein [Mesorhizobium amorphae]